MKQKDTGNGTVWY